MISELRPCITLLALLTLMTGVVYPAAVTLVAQGLFSRQANGSVITRNIEGRETPVGSELIGQAFDSPRYFWGRPSATAEWPYNAASSGGSNLGPTNPALRELVRVRIAHLRAAHPEREGSVPVDLVTASGSGLDPHISLAAAEYQATRVGKARGLAEREVRELIASHTEGRTFGILGEPRVNVLKLNLALDSR